MYIHQKIADWLETHWLAPAYSGWLVGGLAIFFFGAATNTMSGWLYVISGVMLALLAIAAVLSERSLKGMRITRRPIDPVSVGEPLTVELELENQTNQSKTLVQIQDLLPHVLNQPIQTAVEMIPAQKSHHWVYQQPTQRRGVYRWQTVQLRTAAPLGLFWCRRSQSAKAIAVVYPTVLPLNQCPLVDEIGQDINPSIQSDFRTQGATEGITRTLRPYRWGDPTRLVHWRTSARYGELRVRELEVFTGGQEIIICLDSASVWEQEDFEQAVITAASLYFYAIRRNLQVSLWTAGTGCLRGDRPVLEALAAVYSQEDSQADRLPEIPLVWLSQNSTSLNALPPGSRWVLWSQPFPNETVQSAPLHTYHSGLVIQSDQSLQLQLQALANNVGFSGAPRH